MVPHLANSLSKELRDNIVNSRLLVKDKSSAKEPIYGINTGFGKLSQIKINNSELNNIEKILPVYYNHFYDNPDSLIIKY